ncbi:tripartite tricarboxylate transporter substrate binding protein [Ramlibacter sp. G-1-2-2]|uniref:Tripartite tricarboxylate transporter substrate binding protein n=1 Tax=Ramlibacter agri TaxID=2728837 RepID=A0A848H9X4_9BURK|nr:tripartite tricarboxylate transporter substrate binding protein [Ramlibacter agri]NML46240.1 tripartite tricarboxylate transporter substrate binding protein [Ramlibacter agri]
MKFQRRQVLAAFAAGAVSPFALAQANWPTKPIKIVVPFGPGGVADLTARAVGEALGAKLGQAVIIDNKPGAGGITGGDAVVRAAPDGYTLFLMSNGTAVSAGLFSKLPFDPQKDFAPISLLGTFDLAVIVPENSRFKNLGELLAAAKANPGKLNIATIAVGSTQNLAAELFKTTAGIDVQVVPFNGSPMVITALRGGQVDAAIEILAPLKGQIQSKALRPLAVLGERRPADMKDVPTVAESGGALAGFNVASWNALAAPAHTPKEIITKLNHELQALLMQPEMKKKLADINVDARSSTPEQLAGLLSSEIKRWSDVIARAKIPRQ